MAPMRSLSTVEGMPDKSSIVIGEGLPTPVREEGVKILQQLLPSSAWKPAPWIEDKIRIVDHGALTRGLPVAAERRARPDPNSLVRSQDPVVFIVRYCGGVTDMASPTCTGLPSAPST
jgi:hypothetical protein